MDIKKADYNFLFVPQICEDAFAQRVLQNYFFNIEKTRYLWDESVMYSRLSKEYVQISSYHMYGNQNQYKDLDYTDQIRFNAFLNDHENEFIIDILKVMDHFHLTYYFECMGEIPNNYASEVW